MGKLLTLPNANLNNTVPDNWFDSARITLNQWAWRNKLHYPPSGVPLYISPYDPVPIPEGLAWGLEYNGVMYGCLVTDTSTPPKRLIYKFFPFSTILIQVI